MNGPSESPAPAVTGSGAHLRCSAGEPNADESIPSEDDVQDSLVSDSRFSFLCAASSHYRLVYEREEELGYAFNCVTRLFDRLFTAEVCQVCSLAPCGNPSFCKSCSEADQRPRRAAVKVVDKRPTPPTVIEAVMYCVRDRGLKALKEPKVSAWLDECDAAAKQQLKSRIKKLNGAGENELRRTA